MDFQLHNQQNWEEKEGRKQNQMFQETKLVLKLERYSRKKSSSVDQENPETAGETWMEEEEELGEVRERIMEVEEVVEQV